jgi:hypothetical protein
MTPRERAAVERHMERSAATQRAASATPERVAPSRVQSQKDTITKGSSVSHVQEKFARPASIPRRPSRSATPDHNPPARIARSFSREHLAKRKEGERGAVTAKASPKHKFQGSRIAAENVATTKDTCHDEEWVRCAANAHERAERRRDIVKSKCDKALATEKSRVCIFRRPLGPSAALNTQ